MTRAWKKVTGNIISNKEMQGYDKLKERNLWLGSDYSGCSVSRWLVTTVLLELWCSNCVKQQQQQNRNSSCLGDSNFRFAE
jgi:hypothetical protein